MKFDKEFKDEMDLLSPSEEQIERIKKGVYERIEREKAEPVNIPKPRKKPVWIKIAAISGTACAAALVIVVLGSRPGLMIPGMSDSANFTNNSIKSEVTLNYGTDMAPTAASDYLSGGFDINAEVCNSKEGQTGDTAVGGNIKDEVTMQGDSGSHITQSTSPSSSYTPHLSFSEDKESCTVTLGEKTLTYKKANIYGSALNSYSDLESGILQAANNDHEKKLLVHFDENELYVFYESGELFGYYKAE